MKKALITGVTGQDGAYLAQFLLGKGYDVCGLVRRTSFINTSRLQWLGIEGDVRLELGDLEDLSSLSRIITSYAPDEIYNLGAQSFVKASFDQPLLTAQATGVGALNILEAIRISGLKPRLYQASTSEMFGGVQGEPQDENTSFHPRSPYGVAKLFAHWSMINYRESYNMFNCCGILFNHESPLRGTEFVTRKVCRSAAAISLGMEKELSMGNLEAKRDWGHARDFVEAMWLMLQQETPDDFVIATGETRSVRQLCEEAFNCVGLNYQDHVKIDSSYFRPAEVDVLQGNPEKAKRILSWQPKTTFSQMIAEMVEADLKRLREGRSLQC